ncbi:DUF1616 domain-containing protein [Natrinema marinum]|uniref:DUF1616 domain-containing protein n=1 Tax=Natrinema marinum TaxID=2961598 RepID=UPI0020C9298F|nr:DUF1616 domain-containing protein [Natrinema marinum]
MERLRSIREVPRLARRPPADLAAVLAAIGLVNVVTFAPVVRHPILRVPVVLAFVLFVPGYAVVAALFPERNRSVDREAETEHDGAPDDGSTSRSRAWWGTVDGVDRAAFSVAFSVVVVPLTGAAVSLAGWELRPGPILVALSVATAFTTAVAIRRRAVVPPARRFRVPYRQRLIEVRSALFGSDTRGESILNVALVATVVLALVSVGYAATVLPEDDEFSTIYLLSDGEDIESDSYLSDLEQNQTAAVTVGIDNQEGRGMNYTVVAVEQTVDSDGNDTVVRRQRELDRFNATVAAGETVRFDSEVDPTLRGEDARVAWLLYRNGAPAEPSTAGAYRYVSLTFGNETSGNETVESVAA